MTAGHELRSLIRHQFARVGGDDTVLHSGLPSDDSEFAEVLAALGEVRDKRVLDVGCGKGRMMRALAARGAHVLGVDPVWGFLSQAMGGAGDVAGWTAALAGDSEWLPLAGESFDGVLCIEALEHVPDTSRALAALTRVLRSGGRLVIIDKNIRGLDRKWLVPVALKKWWLERRGQRMYPPDFPFREKWFRPKQVQTLLERHCARVEIRYLVLGRMLIPPLFRAVPGLQQYVSWRAVK